MSNGQPAVDVCSGPVLPALRFQRAMVIFFISFYPRQPIAGKTNTVAVWQEERVFYGS